MNIEELVPLPEPMVFQPPGFGTDGSYTAEQLLAHSEAVAAAVAKRCADLCQQSDEDGEGPDCWGWHAKDYADAIRREFGEVSNDDQCQCRECLRRRDDRRGVLPLELTRMIVCGTCGNKRCPHATDHRNTCTNSNEPGQKGSAYE